MKIVFSIPVHERAESVFDMLENIFAFHDDCGVVLHLSQSFEISSPYVSEKTFFKVLETCEPYSKRVIVNPIRWNTYRMNGGVHLFLNAHFSNFDYACEKFGDFEYFMFMASNELYLKKGAYDLMKNFDAGLNNLRYQNWTQQKLALHDLRPRRMLRELGIQDFTISMVEGTFFKREYMRQIIDILKPWIDHKLPPTGYAMEELYFPTVARKVIPADRIYTGQLTRIDLDHPATIPLVDELIQLPNVFAYKRVDRNFDDNARRYIGEKIGHYRDNVEKLFWMFPMPIDPEKNPNVSPLIVQLSKILFTVKVHVARGRLKSEDIDHDVEALNLYFRIHNDPQVSPNVWRVFMEDLYNIIRMLFIRLVLNPDSQPLKILEDLIYRKLAEIYKQSKSADNMEKWQIEDGLLLAANTRRWKRLPPQDFEMSAVEMSKSAADNYLNKKDNWKALQILNKAKSLESGLSKDYYFTLSQVYRALGNKDEAIKAYEQSF